VGRGPTNLTVNSAKNVVFVILYECKLQEFTAHGTVLQTIQLQWDIQHQRGVFVLTNGQLMISHTGTHHHVCTVDVQGSVQIYRGTPGSVLTKMSSLEGSTVDKNGSIVVADWSTNRQLVLDHSLTSAHEMSMSIDGGLERPHSLCYDNSRGHLYIGELLEGRVIIIDYLKDFTTSHVSSQRK